MTTFPVRHSYPSLRPTHKTGGGVGWGLKRIEETGQSGREEEGLKRTGVWIREIKKERWCERSNRELKNAKERRGIEWKISLISGSFTHSQPLFPFPPIISTSSYPVLGRVGGVFFCAVRWCHSLLYRQQKAPPPSSSPTPHPSSPAIQDPSSNIPELRHVFWFIEISGASPPRLGPVFSWLNCSLNTKYSAIQFVLGWLPVLIKLAFIQFNLSKDNKEKNK